MLQGQKLQVNIKYSKEEPLLFSYSLFNPKYGSGFSLFDCLLKGVSTAREVYEVLNHCGWLEMFPLFSTVHEICTGRLKPEAIVHYRDHKA